MPTEIRRPLSSRCLYHFKKELETVKLVLQRGFSHRLLRESIPYREYEQLNFLVCFCDMRWEDSRMHRDCYGENAIVLTKQWGIAKGVSPVRYVHENSPGAGAHYLAIKNMLRFARSTAGDNRAHVIQDLLATSLLKDEGMLRYVSTATSFALEPGVGARADALDAEFQSLLKQVGNAHAGLIARYLGSLVARILELNNELEARDSLTRRYTEDFQCPSTGKTSVGRVLYDEREWRSVKHVSDLDLQKTPSLFDEAMANRCLPVSYNLTFTDSDVVALVTEDQPTKLDLLRYISAGNTLLAKSFNRVFVVGEYDERVAEAGSGAP